MLTQSSGASHALNSSVAACRISPDFAAREHRDNGYVHPLVKEHVGAIHETFSKYRPQIGSFKSASVHEQKTSHEIEHHATVMKFVTRFNAKPAGQAKPHEYLHLDGKDGSWILGKHQPGQGRKVVWWLSKHERLK